MAAPKSLYSVSAQGRAYSTTLFANHAALVGGRVSNYWIWTHSHRLGIRPALQP